MLTGTVCRFLPVAAFPARLTLVGMPSVTFVHTPSAGSKTYTVHAFNMGANVRNLFINRSEADTDSANFPRTASALVIQEVAV
jgi:hypothetical protein